MLPDFKGFGCPLGHIQTICVTIGRQKDMISLSSDNAGKIWVELYFCVTFYQLFLPEVLEPALGALDGVQRR
jgi:hypothetical protein